MSIFRAHIVLEAGIAAALVAAASLMWNPGDPMLSGIALHPGWLAVLVLTARYGAAGFFLGFGAVLAALSTAGAAVGVPVVAAVEGRLGQIGDVFALGAALPIAWVAMLHENRRRELDGRAAKLEEQVRCERRAADALREAVLTLRSKSDRVDCSLTFWRRIATRLHEGEPTQAARAALELCAVRIGARAALVRIRRGGRWENLVWRGSWTEDAPVPADIFSDRTIDAAFDRGCAVVATEVEEIGTADSDVAVPVVDADAGRIVGVLALRGVPLARLGDAERGDLSEVAAWLSTPLIRAASDPAAEAPSAPTPSPSPPGGRSAVWS